MSPTTATTPVPRLATLTKRQNPLPFCLSPPRPVCLFVLPNTHRAASMFWKRPGNTYLQLLPLAKEMSK